MIGPRQRTLWRVLIVVHVTKLLPKTERRCNGAMKSTTRLAQNATTRSLKVSLAGGMVCDLLRRMASPCHRCDQNSQGCQCTANRLINDSIAQRVIQLIATTQSLLPLKHASRATTTSTRTTTPTQFTTNFGRRSSPELLNLEQVFHVRLVICRA